MNPETTTPTETQTPESAENAQPTKPANRYYSVKESSAGLTGGRYSSSVGISQAAHKAATQLFRRAPPEVETIEFTLREVKNRSGVVKFKGKEYAFEATRTKRETPLMITLHGKEVKIEHTYRVKMIRKKEKPTEVESQDESNETPSSS